MTNMKTQDEKINAAEETVAETTTNTVTEQIETTENLADESSEQDVIQPEEDSQLDPFAIQSYLIKIESRTRRVCKKLYKKNTKEIDRVLSLIRANVLSTVSEKKVTIKKLQTITVFLFVVSAAGSYENIPYNVFLGSFNLLYSLLQNNPLEQTIEDKTAIFSNFFTNNSVKVDLDGFAKELEEQRKKEELLRQRSLTKKIKRTMKYLKKKHSIDLDSFFKTLAESTNSQEQQSSETTKDDQQVSEPQNNEQENAQS
jgi:hypothetical protein